MSEALATATIEDFEKLDIRVGKVVEVTPYPEGRYSTHILLVDFGSELGTKKSLTKLAPNGAECVRTGFDAHQPTKARIRSLFQLLEHLEGRRILDSSFDSGQ